MTNRRMIRLLRRYLEGTASSEDRARVEKWWAAFPGSDALTEEGATGPIREALYQRIRYTLDGGGRVVPLHRRGSFRVAAAACVVVLTLGSWWFLRRPAQPLAQPAVVQSLHDVAPPATNRATLTLANGQTIALDSVGSGLIASQDHARVQKTAAGRVQYTATNSKSGAAATVSYNTISVPRGSRIVDLTLADGTRVWLNSASSLRYPTVFTGPDRAVELTGEGYFEAAADPGHPFLVRRGGLEVRVLGTQFNVNAYPDEPVIRVTLLQGAVAVSQDNRRQVLKPGDQAIAAAGSLATIRDPDIEATMAWKNGQFLFGDEADIPSVMRQIARWYNVDVEYQGTPAGHIGGSISREVNVSQVLKMLELTGAVRFRVEGRKVTVLSAK